MMPTEIADLWQNFWVNRDDVEYYAYILLLLPVNAVNTLLLLFTKLLFFWKNDLFVAIDCHYMELRKDLGLKSQW